MVFHPIETVFGLNHLRLAMWRKFFKVSPQYFLKRFDKKNIVLKQAISPEGLSQYCEICGFAIAQIEDNDGWVIEFCSAYPPVNMVEEKLWKQIQTLKNINK